MGCEAASSNVPGKMAAEQFENNQHVCQDQTARSTSTSSCNAHSQFQSVETTLPVATSSLDQTDFCFLSLADEDSHVVNLLFENPQSGFNPTRDLLPSGQELHLHSENNDVSNQAEEYTTTTIASSDMSASSNSTAVIDFRWWPHVEFDGPVIEPMKRRPSRSEERRRSGGGSTSCTVIPGNLMDLSAQLHAPTTCQREGHTRYRQRPESSF